MVGTYVRDYIELGFSKKIHSLLPNGQAVGGLKIT